MKYPDYPGMAVWYASQVVEGHVNACRWETLACQRFLKMRGKALGKKYSDYTWSDAHLVDICSFTEKLSHTKGFEGTIVLEPVQMFWFAGIFAFRQAKTGLRWTRKVSFWVPRKNGKALALDTPIPTPTGWKAMRDIGVGDEVLARDGTATRVIAESPIYLNHECFRVAFSNGESIVADAGHRWLTAAHEVGGGGGRSGIVTRVRTTQEIFETQTYGARGDRNHSVAMPGPMVGEHRELPVHPYLLGAWLGDGTSDSANLSCSAADTLEMARLLEECGIETSVRVARTCNTITMRPVGAVAIAVDGRRPTISRSLAFVGVLANKHIPAAYLRASVEQRLALLQGLMDTDGTITKLGEGLTFCTTSPALRDGFSELLATFGIKFKVRERESVCNGRPLGTMNWCIQFFSTRDRVPAFRLKRKLDRMRVSTGGGARSRTVQIVSVERVPSVPVKCIGVEHKDHLFLAGRTMLPTHNTALGVAIVLFCCNFEGEVGAEGVISAASEDQANIPYNAIRATLAADEDLRDFLQARDSREGAFFQSSGGSIRLALSRAKNLDGLNPHIILAEELHAQAEDVIGVLRTAQGARAQPIEVTLSTAGRDIGAPAYDDWKHCQAVLEGAKVDDQRFVMLYAGDERDEHNRFDHRVIEKLNPLYGTALRVSAIDAEIIEARMSEPKLQEFLRTRINRWRRAAGNLISMDAWNRCSDDRLNLDLFKGFPMYVGIDLASRQDLNAAQFIVRVDKTLYTTGLYWLCENSPRFKDDRYRDTFMGWAQKKHLILTPGAHINYKLILEDIFKVLVGHNVLGVGIDDYQGNLMATEIEEAGHSVFLVRKNAKHLTQSTEDIIARTNDPALFQHDGNPVTAWCAGNVVGYWDHNDNVLPKKEKRNSGNNIDGMDALIVANALRLDDEAGHLGVTDRRREMPNPYLERGLIGWSS